MNAVDGILKDYSSLENCMENFQGVVMEFRFKNCYTIKAIEFEWNLNLDPKNYSV